MFVNLEKAYKTFGKRAEEKTDRAIFTCIAEHANPEGTAFVPQNTIADETGYARRTVANSIHRLAEKGFLTIEKSLTDNTGTVRGIASNIYRINPKYLTKPAQRTTKPQCSACCECEQSERKHGQREHKLEITIDDVLAYSGANSQRIEGLWKRVTKLEDHQCDVDDRLARIGEVAADVIHDLLAAYENKENTK